MREAAGARELRLTGRPRARTHLPLDADFGRGFVVPLEVHDMSEHLAASDRKRGGLVRRREAGRDLRRLHEGWRGHGVQLDGLSCLPTHDRLDEICVTRLTTQSATIVSGPK